MGFLDAGDRQSNFIQDVALIGPSTTHLHMMQLPRYLFGTFRWHCERAPSVFHAEQVAVRLAIDFVFDTPFEWARASAEREVSKRNSLRRSRWWGPWGGFLWIRAPLEASIRKINP